MGRKVAEKIKTRILCPITPSPPPENLAVYEIKLRNIAEPQLSI
jgi:hypothetical protein